MQYPKIRYVDAFPVETESGKMIALRDPSGIASDTLILSPDIFYLLQFFDGQHSELDLCNDYRQAFNRVLYTAQIRDILDKLDQHFFLDNITFSKELERQRDQFISLPVRPAAHSGESYESGPDQLNEQLSSYFSNIKSKENGRPKEAAIKGMIVPHIDIRAGGQSYAHAYQALLKRGGADCFVILGTGHSGLNNLYSILEKDFSTPYGTVAYDRKFTERFKSKYNNFNSADLLTHKREHSIEFQVVFLQHVLRQVRDFTIVPILCSFSHFMLDAQHFEREKKIVDDFSKTLRETIAESRGRVCVIASVDLSHIGPRYGDDSSPDDNFMTAVRKADQSVLEKTRTLDQNGFLDIFAENDDRFRVCGFSPIYTLLKSLDAKKGQLLDYADAIVDTQKSVVTFASMIFD